MTLTAMACQANMPDPSVELAQLNEQYTEILNLYDAVIRGVRNPKVSSDYARMFASLIDEYPALLEQAGVMREIDVQRVRQNAGNRSESTATRFFQDLDSIGAGKYEVIYDEKLKRRRSFFTSGTLFAYPESFDLSTPSRKRRAKEAEKKAEKQFKDPRKLWHCEICGGDLLYDATPHCKSCGHVHTAIKDIPAAEITIEAEVHEVTDEDWLNEWDTPTIEVQAVSPAVQQQLPETPRPAPLGKHPRGIACPDCHAMNNWRAVPTDWGGEIYVCAICYPE